MDDYLYQYLERYPNEFQIVMSGLCAFGHTEMQQILKVALSANKKFNLEYDVEKLDLATYKLVSFEKK